MNAQEVESRLIDLLWVCVVGQGNLLVILQSCVPTVLVATILLDINALGQWVLCKDELAGHAFLGVPH